MEFPPNKNLIRERWDCKNKRKVYSKRVDDFLTEIIEICKKHNLSISHEDIEGSFIVKDLNFYDASWLCKAMMHLEDKE